MDHEHIFKKIGTWRKYDVVQCQYVGPAKKHKRTTTQAASKNSKVTQMCGVTRFTITPRPRKNKDRNVIMLEVPIFVAAHPQKNGFWQIEFIRS